MKIRRKKKKKITQCRLLLASQIFTVVSDALTHNRLELAQGEPKKEW